jgi:hypothetical protein
MTAPTRSDALAPPLRAVEARRSARGALLFAAGIALVLWLYSTIAIGSAGQGFEALTSTGAERTGPFRSVMLHLEPSRLVIGVVIGAAVAVLALGRLLRHEAAAAVRRLTLVAVVLLLVVATAAGWMWLRTAFSEQTGFEGLRDGAHAVPWPLDATIVTEPWPD